MAKKGIPQTQKHKNKIGESNKKILKEYFQTERGKKQAKEHSVKMTGKKQTLESNRKRSEKLRGAKCHFWKGGITKEQGYWSFM